MSARGLKFYRLDIPGGEDNLDESEHFTSLAAARRRRRELEPTAEPGTLAIERLVLVALPARALALRLLNQKGYVAERVEVVPAYDPAADAVERGDYDNPDSS